MKLDFADWLQGELDRRSWSQAELARRAEVTRSVINTILNRKSFPGVEACRGIARAFNLPPGEVFRQAELLPKSSMPDDPLACRINIVIEQLDEERRVELYRYAKYHLQQQKGRLC